MAGGRGPDSRSRERCHGHWSAPWRPEEVLATPTGRRPGHAPDTHPPPCAEVGCIAGNPGTGDSVPGEGAGASPRQESSEAFVAP